MPRNPNAGPSTLRNRNRVTNKTRLKVIHGNIDADPHVLDEDEEKARVVSTAGVEAEDANEHHLQAVLSAAAQRHQSQRSARASGNEKEKAPVAYIPTPDSTGLVDNYDELYPSDRWKDPIAHLRWSSTVEESITNGLNNGFVYYMDECDKEWLDKNNEQARGEGTSAQGAVSSRSGHSQRSSKAKGKEPDLSAPVVMSEDEFELVMAVFEKVTHDKTEYLHHALENGMPFPPFTDYQDTFSAPLPPSMFADFITPSWLPAPSHLLRLAWVVYPHWRERRLEAGGKRIIPTVNLDETDTRNESYICFRRREIKAIRKTRASHVTFSDKLVRLQNELATAFEIANEVIARETVKKEAAQLQQDVWNRRILFSDLKRKFPTLSTKEDEELLIDKERVTKKPKVETRMSLKLRTAEATPQLEPLVQPRERAAVILQQIERDLAKVKERDHGCWDDQVENSLQSQLVPLSQRYFKVFKNSPSLEEDSSPRPRVAVALRRRLGRGGILHYDRRVVPPITTRRASRGPIDDYLGFGPTFPQRLEALSEAEREDRTSRMAERWRYDEDDRFPAFEGPEELERQLVDDYEAKYMRHHMTLLHDPDHQALTTDPTLTITTPEGKQVTVLPFRLGPTHSQPRREVQATIQRSAPVQTPIPSMPPGTPISMQSQLKKMQPLSMSSVRVPSSGSMRPPAPPTMPAISTHVSQPTDETPSDTSSPAPPEAAPQEVVPQPQPEVQAQPQLEPTIPASTSTSPVRPPSQGQQPPAVGMNLPVITNSYHIPVPGFSTAISNSTPLPYSAQTSNVLSAQQMQNIKMAFAEQTPSIHQLQPTTGNILSRVPAQYIGHVNGVGYDHLQVRQLQWAQQRIPTNGLNGTTVSQPNGYTGAFQPSAVNGIRTNGITVGHVVGQHSSSPLLQSTSPIPNGSMHGSPPRPSSQSSVTSSPSMQTQTVGVNGRYS